jgi:hypothetical protein
MMAGERKTRGSQSGSEPRSFAPPRPERTPGIGAIRQDVGEDPGDLSPESMADDPGAPRHGKNGRKLGHPMRRS